MQGRRPRGGAKTLTDQNLRNEGMIIRTYVHRAINHGAIKADRRTRRRLGWSSPTADDERRTRGRLGWSSPTAGKERRKRGRLGRSSPTAVGERRKRGRLGWSSPTAVGERRKRGRLGWSNPTAGKERKTRGRLGLRSPTAGEERMTSGACTYAPNFLIMFCVYVKRNLLSWWPELRRGSGGRNQDKNTKNSKLNFSALEGRKPDPG